MFGDVFRDKTRWKKLPFDAVFKDETKRGLKIKSDNYMESGLYPIIDQGKNYVAGYRNQSEGIYDDVPAIVFGDHTRVFKYVDFPFFLGADGVKILKSRLSEINYVYLYYHLLTADIPNEGYGRHFKWLKKLTIALPPIELQEKFAEFAGLSDKSKSELKQSLFELKAVRKRIISENFD